MDMYILGYLIYYIIGNGLGGATFALTLAQKYGAIVFALEHRFYGRS